MSKEGESSFGLDSEYNQLFSGLRNRFSVFYQLVEIPVSDYWLYPDKDIPMVTAHILQGVMYLKKYGKDQFLKNLGRGASTLLAQDRVRIIPTRGMVGFPKKAREKFLPGFSRFGVVEDSTRSELDHCLQIYVPAQFLLKVNDPAILMADITFMASFMRDILHGKENVEREKICLRAKAYTAHFLFRHLAPIARQKLTGIYRQILHEFPYGLFLGCDDGILYDEDRRGLSDPLDDLEDLYYG